ncbi:MAG: hypothetical protein AB7O98_17245 [Hyphomonadaceae bacterium]
MARVDEKSTSLWRALKDLGWFPLLLIGLGGFSILSIVERIVFRQPLDLYDPLEMILAGYNRLVHLLAGVADLALRPVVTWLSEALGWTIAVDPVWIPLLVLLMIPTISIARATMSSNVKEGLPTFVIFCTVTLLVGALLDGVAAGSQGSWLRYVAPAPFIALMIAAAATGFLSYAHELDLDLNRGRARMIAWPATLIAAVIAFVVYRQVGGGGHVLAVIFLIFGLAAYGAAVLATGLLAGSAGFARVGLTVIGGFLAAALVLGASSILKAVGAD